MKKKDLGPFHVILVGDWTILARMQTRRHHIHPVTGEQLSWFDVGGLRIHPDPKNPGMLLFTPGNFSIDMNAVQRHTLKVEPLIRTWLVAGALIGETYISYDNQPKKRGPRNCPVFDKKIKRREDFTQAVELWRSWLKWRESGSVERFEVFHLGPLEKYTAGKKLTDADAAARLYEARCRAIGQRLQGDYGLSLDRDVEAASLKAIKAHRLTNPTPKKTKKTKT